MAEITARQQLYAMLQNMNSSTGNSWSETHYMMYEMALEGLDDETILLVARHMIKAFTWRPAPAELLDMAAKLTSPLPALDVVYAEMLAQCDNPNKKISHPIVHEIAQNVGGWGTIEDWHTDSLASLRKMISETYSLAAARWEKTVKEQLALPRRERDMKYFPNAKPRLEIAS